MDDFYDFSCSHAYSKVSKHNDSNFVSNTSDPCAFDEEFDRMYQEFLSLEKKFSNPNYDWSQY